MRAADRFKGLPIPTSLTADDILNARKFWLKETQMTYFGKELNTCSQNTAFLRSHPLLKLSPFVDADGILRVGGRLKISLLSADNKHPAILPCDSPFSCLVISDLHQQTLHGGVQVVLATLRQQYWISSAAAP